jgi:ribose transport system substrate-binding protein
MSMHKIVRAAAVGFALSSALFLSACNDTDTADTGDTGSASDESLSIGFFGFSKTNSFAQAAYAGISEYAKENDATAEFIDPNFDVQVQLQQLKDALTSKRYDVWIVQANDGVAVQQTIEEAVDAGITVVAEFTPIGPDFETLKPQVPGTLSLVDDPKRNGTVLGELSLQACEDAGADPCQVAYLQGFSAQPIDVVRTEAFLAAVDKPGVEVVANVEGGYAQDTGRSAVQDILQANPDVNVIAGASSAALLGAIDLPGIDDVRIVGNGSSTQAVTAVQDGDFFAVYVFAEKTAGAKAAEMGLAAARGDKVDPEYLGYDELTPFGVLGTKDNLEGYTGEYSD